MCCASPDWTLHFSSSTNLHVHHLNVHNPLEPNADGIDIDSSQNVLVEVSLATVPLEWRSWVMPVVLMRLSSLSLLLLVSGGGEAEAR